MLGNHTKRMGDEAVEGLGGVTDLFQRINETFSAERPKCPKKQRDRLVEGIFGFPSILL
jgi:hypothetical protein